MAIYILPDDTVVDLGCGMMWLKESLTKPTYIYSCRLQTERWKKLLFVI